jgi:phosphoenolpyruvate-protein phosphotransferase (PTS system enzyme I)
VAVRGEIRKEGIAASAGVAIGRAYLVDRRAVKTPKRHLEVDEVEDEVARFHRAIAMSDRQLEKVKQKLAEQSESDQFNIITAHQLMLHDEHLVDETVRYIRDEKINSEWGLRKTVERIKGVFDSIADDYFRERRSDVDFVGERVLRNLMGRETGPVQPPPDAIVVAYDLSPADTAQLHKAAVAGLLTDAGGKTSHTAIIARAHEIPAVVGLEDITNIAETDDLLIVDGTNGMVIVNPTPQTVGAYRDQQRRQAAIDAALMSNAELPARSLDGITLELYANIDGPDEIASALEHGAVGVGLIRTEYLILTSEKLPTEEDHYRMAVQVLELMGGRPTTFRTFDLGADKLSRLLDPGHVEANPALGLRSIRLCLTDEVKPLFKQQLRGLLRATMHGPVRIMFPMISGVLELRMAKAVVEEVKRDLRSEGIAFDEKVKIGIMIEMPSAALTADLLAKECDFFSIGTNDLIQYTMAVDRVNEWVSYLYEPLHPALLKLIGDVARAGREGGISVTVCGEMAGDPVVAPVLIGLGIHELSMSAVSIPEVKSVLRGSAVADLERLVARVISLPTAQDIREEVAEYLDQHGLHRGASI